MMKDLIVYLKTTDTCQLDCDHCFTSGSSGRKGWFDPKQTIQFFKSLKNYVPSVRGGNISFHGGEPLLCPTTLLFEAWAGIKDLWPNVWWSTQTNLTYNLTPERINVLEKICNKSWGTSWDYKIRWKTPKQYFIWKENVKHLASQGHDITLMVSLNKNLIEEKEPIAIIDEMAELGIKHINFERITPNGNATKGSSLLPENKNLDRWFLKMWEQTQEHEAWKTIDNMFLDSVLSSMVYGTYSGCRSRQCEQKIFTINASGSIGGCPNDATENFYGNIHDPIESVIFNPRRMCNIQKEAVRNPVCSNCEVYDICNGDCHQLAWQGDVCAAPKSLMRAMKQEKEKLPLYKEIMNGFMGQE